MNPNYRQIITASEEDRRGLFLATANRMGTAIQNVEKDFWVCWALDALFSGLPAGGPRFLFKGGTSLSKGFGLIKRFSEDIDITVFRSDLGHGMPIAALEQLGTNAQERELRAIRDNCSTYINGPLVEQLRALTAQASGAAATAVEPDPGDESAQSLLLSFPMVSNFDGSNLSRAVKIESGAKSALDPHLLRTIKPYVADDVPFDLAVPNVVTVAPERTFWDKIIILHGLRRWFETRGSLRNDGQRVSRHYYDLHCLLHSPMVKAALANRALGEDCVRHAQMFFNRPGYDLAHAKPGTLALVPPPSMAQLLRGDYADMAGMIFGDVPPFDEVLRSVAHLEETLNRPQAN